MQEPRNSLMSKCLERQFIENRNSNSKKTEEQPSVVLNGINSRKQLLAVVMTRIPQRKLQDLKHESLILAQDERWRRA